MFLNWYASLRKSVTSPMRYFVTLATPKLSHGQKKRHMPKKGHLAITASLCQKKRALARKASLRKYVTWLKLLSWRQKLYLANASLCS